MADVHFARRRGARGALFEGPVGSYSSMMQAASGQDAPRRGARPASGLASRALVLAVLGCGLVGRAADANPHSTLTYVPFVVAVYVLPTWYATGVGRPLWSRYAGALLAVQAVLTYVPFAVFGNTWVGGASGLFGALVLLLLPAAVRWWAFGGLVAVELGMWLLVGLPYEPTSNAVGWVLVAFVNGSLSGFALNRLADLLDGLAASRHRYVAAAVARQRLAAAGQLQDRIVNRLGELSGHAGAMVRSTDASEVRPGLTAIGQLARTAAADARRLVLELPDPSAVDLPHPDGSTAVAPRLARGVGAAVVLLFATQFLLNVLVPAAGPTTDPLRVTAALVVAALAVGLTARHLGLLHPGERPRGWPWTLALLTVLSFTFYPAVGASSLVLLPYVGAGGLVLIRHWSRWLVLGAVVVALPVLTLTRPGAEMSTLHLQLQWSLYAGATLATACLLIYGLSQFTKAATAVQAAQRDAADAAATAEQLRVAQDAHDALGLGLSTIALKSDLALALLETDPDQARREAIQIMHLSAIVARDAESVGAGTLELDLQTELAGARQILQAAGIDVRLDASSQNIAPHGAVLAAVLREAVTNVLRHSHASRCAITIREDEAGGLVLELTNDGACGTEATSTGHGLRNMAERLRPLGGRLETRRDGDRHVLTALIPASPATTTTPTTSSVPVPG